MLLYKLCLVAKSTDFGIDIPTIQAVNMMDTRPAICGQAAYLLDTPIPLDLSSLIKALEDD